MEHQLTITLPDALFQPLVEAALRAGRTPENLILEKVAQAIPAQPASPEPERKADITQFFGMWKGGAPNGSDNEQIDADLAREYANESIRPTRTPLGAHERREAMNELMRYAGTVSSGNPHAADNEQIDADLAREYGRDL